MINKYKTTQKKEIIIEKYKICNKEFDTEDDFIDYARNFYYKLLEDTNRRINLLFCKLIYCVIASEEEKELLKIGIEHEGANVRFDDDNENIKYPAMYIEVPGDSFNSNSRLMTLDKFKKTIHNLIDSL